MNDEFIYSLAPDTLRSIALQTPYADLLKLLRAFPLCLKHLHTAFWRLKGMEELSISTSTREEYVEQATYSGDVLEGSEKYLFLDHCIMRAGQKKDRQLIKYFLNKGASSSFAYYGLISNIEKDDIQDLLDTLDWNTEKEGYFYRKCEVLGEKQLLDKVLERFQMSDSFPLGHIESEGFWSAVAARGMIHVAHSNVTCYDLPEMRKADAHNLTAWSISTDKFNDAIDILNKEDMPRKEIVEFGHYICGPRAVGFFDNLAIGIVIGCSRYPERIEAIIERACQYFNEEIRGVKWGEDVGFFFLDELRRGHRWGQFLVGKADMVNEQPWAALVKFMTLRGYKKPIESLMIAPDTVGYSKSKFVGLYNYICNEYGIDSRSNR